MVTARAGGAAVSVQIEADEVKADHQRVLAGREPRGARLCAYTGATTTKTASWYMFPVRPLYSALCENTDTRIRELLTFCWRYPDPRLSRGFTKCESSEARWQPCLTRESR